MKSNIVSSRPSDLRGNNAVQALRDGRCDRCCVEIVFSFCFVALDFPPALVSGEPRERRVVQTAGNEHHPVKQGDRLTSHLPPQVIYRDMKGGNLMSITTPVFSSILRVIKNNFLLTSLES